MKLITAFSGLALAFLFLFSWNTSFTTDHSSSEETLLCDCLLDLGPDITLELGEEIELTPAISCLPDAIASFSWSEATSLSCTDCFEPIAKPFEDACYTLSIEWQDGCISEEEICVTIKSCDTEFSENEINGVSPQQINNEATIEMKIARTQYVYIEIVDGDEIEYALWEGWLKAGLQTRALDFSQVPSGNHELRARLYPENQFITIEKL